MGANMAKRLLQSGQHQVFGFDLSEVARGELTAAGGLATGSLPELVGQMKTPRAVWLMVPAGQPTDSTIDQLLTLLSAGDTIIDGGNSNYHDSIARGTRCQDLGVHFIDAGTSGGVWGLENGYCLMVGGEDEAVARLLPVFQKLAPQDGFLHVGPVGSGHFVKMIHNGIEYGLMQAYAEGFAIMQAKTDYQLDLANIAKLWGNGSVVRSWLLELAAIALTEDQGLAHTKGYVDDSGEGRWTAEEALELGVPAPVISLSLMTRIFSRSPDTFSNKLVAALRHQFGGHAVVAEPTGATTST
jgi:6-phosphogluconate dehydrogenase